MTDPLKHYSEILGGRAKASFLLLRNHGVEYDSRADTEELWKTHQLEMDRFHQGLPSPCVELDLMDLKLEIASRMMGSCQLCERRCKADRASGKKGHCGVIEPHISSEFIHRGEEPPLVPSHTIFFAGCTFNCAFCQNFDISTDPQAGICLEPEIIADRIERRYDPSPAGRYALFERSRNVNWVGGDPTPNLLYILRVLRQCQANVPQIWNSNMYLTEESMSLLDGVIDLYLTDFKYGNDDCAKRLSNAPRYWEVVSRNHLIAQDQADVIVRHLVLPNHAECCSIPIMEWLSKNMSGGLVNVMAQYRPLYRAREHKDIAVNLSREEYTRVLDRARELGLQMVL